MSAVPASAVPGRSAARPVSGRPLTRPLTVLLATVVALLAAVVVAPGQRAGADPATDSGVVPAGRFVPITPTRVLDTRSQGGAFLNGQTRTVDTGKAFTPRATAVVVNLTVVTPNGSGFLAAYPAGTARPAASSLNFVVGQNRANQLTVAVGTGSVQDQIAVYVSAGGGGRAHVVVDVVGYYGAGGSGAVVGTSYQPLANPVRIFDTRGSIGALTSTYPRNTGIVTVDYGSPTVNRTIAAVAMTITVTEPTGAGFLTLWDGQGPPPLASALSWVAGQSIGNLAIIPVHCSDSACKTVEFYARNSGSPSTQLVGDIAGMYAAPASNGLLFTPRAPVRVTDTRVGMGYGTLASKATGVTDLSAYAGSDARAVAVNMQAVDPKVTTWLTSWPTGQSKPAVTNLNARAGRVDAIAAQVKLGPGRLFSTSAYWGPTDLVIDLAGTFAPDTAAASAPASAAAVPTSGR